MDLKVTEDIKNKIIKRDLLKEKLTKEIREINFEIFSHASEFDTYEELYLFIKSVCSTTDEFNLAMNYSKEVWFKRG